MKLHLVKIWKLFDLKTCILMTYQALWELYDAHVLEVLLLLYVPIQLRFICCTCISGSSAVIFAHSTKSCMLYMYFVVVLVHSIEIVYCIFISGSFVVVFAQSTLLVYKCQVFPCIPFTIFHTTLFFFSCQRIKSNTI